MSFKSWTADTKTQAAPIAATNKPDGAAKPTTPSQTPTVGKIAKTFAGEK
jgi:hypothetical protein